MNQEVDKMKNEHLHKKLKRELTLSYLYNKNKHYGVWRQIVWNLCECFNVEFTNQLYIVIQNFSYNLVREMHIRTDYASRTDDVFIHYANAHNFRLYDAITHELVNSVQYTTFQYKP